MGLETGTYISELTITNPVGASDPKSQGDDHLRLIKKCVKNSFGAFVGNTGTPKSVTLTEDQINDAALKSATQTITGAWTFSTFPSGGFMKQGLVTVPVMAAGMTSATTNGAAPGQYEAATNKMNIKVLDFDTTTQEFACFSIPMPKSWNNGTVTFQVLWTFASSSGGVVFALEAVACSDGDTLDVAFGTAVQVADTALTANQCHVSATSAAVTVAGTPATSDLINFRLKRVPADGSDTLAADARLIGIRLFFTQNASDDT